MNNKASIEELIRSGDYRQALDLLEDKIELQPDNIDDLKLLAGLSGQCGMYGKTISCCNKILAVQPEHMDTLKNLSQALIYEKDYASSIPVYEKIVRLIPDDAGAVNTLGALYMFLMKFPEAAAHFDRAIELDPEFVDPRLNLARIYSQFGHPGKAIAAYKGIFEIQPDNYQVLSEYASVLMTAGKIDESEISFKKILELQPGHCDAAAGLALLYKKRGDYQKSLDLLRPIIDSDEISALAGVAFANIAKHFDLVDQAIVILEKIVSTSCHEENLVQVHNQLGKLYEQKKQYKKSFNNYSLSNDLQIIISEPLASVKQVGKSLKLWTPEFNSVAPTSTNNSEQPIFIVGLPRSGTSLVEQILSSHSEVYGAGELHALPDLISGLPGMLRTAESYPLCLKTLTAEVIGELADRYLRAINAIAGDTQSLRITDKMPSNFLHIGLIKLMFPNARIVHCMRNPIDTCLSIYFNQFPLAAYTTELVNIGKHYLHYRKIMEHWRNSLGLQIIDISYEALIDNPEKNIRQLVQDCGLTWEDACLDFHSSKRFVNTLSHDQVTQPLYRSSMQRWKNYEEFIQPLIAELSSLDDL